MPDIKNKSIRKLEAAQYLINKGYCTESVHCIYYSSFLYMKHILHHVPSKKGGVTYNKQEIKGVSSHEYVLKLVKERINTPKKRKLVEISFRYLKGMRNKADYSAELISAKECLIIKEKAELLKQTLIKTFGNL